MLKMSGAERRTLPGESRQVEQEATTAKTETNRQTPSAISIAQYIIRTLSTYLFGLKNNVLDAAALLAQPTVAASTGSFIPVAVPSIGMTIHKSP